MADEMTPAEMRKRADTLRKLGRSVSYYGVLGAVGLNDADRVSWARTFVAGADALDRLANLANPMTLGALGRLAWDAVHAHGAFVGDMTDDAYYRAVGESIARGETNERETP